MTLHSINLDLPAQRSQRRQGLGQPSQINRVFQIKVVAFRAASELPRECSLAALTGTEQRHCRTRFQASAKSRQELESFYHALNNGRSPLNIQGFSLSRSFPTQSSPAPISDGIYETSCQGTPACGQLFYHGDIPDQ